MALSRGVTVARSWMALSSSAPLPSCSATLEKGLSSFRIERRAGSGTDGQYRLDVTVRFDQLGAEFLVLAECKDHVRPEDVQVLADSYGSGDHSLRKRRICGSLAFASASPNSMRCLT